MRIGRSAVIYYMIGAVFLWVTCDPVRVNLNRLNYYKDAARYPVEYVEKSAPFDRRQWLYARSYYKSLLKLIPIYEQQGVLDGPLTKSRAYAMIAVCEFYLGYKARALAFMEKAVRQGPRQSWLQYDLALLNFDQNRYGQALAQGRELLPFSKEKLEADMQLDYYESWPPVVAIEYKKLTWQKYYQLMVNSYKLSILAADRSGQKDTARTLALSAIKEGIAGDDKIFPYYAGLSPEQPKEEQIGFLFPPAVYFVPIGQEKMAFARR